jgi:homeobox protein cut-like
LEQLLLARNKKLSNELTVLRVSHQDLQSRLETIQEDLSNTNMDLEKSRNLNATLESDLEKVQQEAANAFPSSAMSVAGTYTSRYPSSSYPGRRGRATSPTSSIISGFDPQHDRNLGSTPLDVLRSGEPVGGGSGILPMITAQRDRFKKKNSELETELQKSHQTVSSLRNEIASLQKDNLNLYEKTRYVSTYNRGGASSTNSWQNAPNPTTIQISGSESPVDTRYRAAYESQISPFAAFRGRESARAVKRMTLPERAVFQVTRMVLQTRVSRNLFAGYCVALHLLVLIMLYYMGGGEVTRTVSVAGAGAASGPLAGAAGGAGSVGSGTEWKAEGFQEGG